MNMVQDELNRTEACLQVILLFSLFSICGYFIDDLRIYILALNLQLKKRLRRLNQ